MRWWVTALGACIAVGIYACDKLPAPAAQIGQLVFAKDTLCADTTTTELFIDAASQGQVTMRPGSSVGFNTTASTHIASAVERAGKLRDFGAQDLYVPALGVATYAMTCGGGTRPPPLPSPPR